ncbi:OLC1v1023031C1 [Oldenlandia corymbosa var. corymbosa]|uniref:OLC1v1023031C1 n=1 Tax=Oldenlandia corymbosa var. corymbosa TaxID=529605 RepID=A0AAV1BZW8_OLDCO|nr:OLC1v1023031C1 [Oldenlandia corymbosa var. corymbosa]
MTIGDEIQKKITKEGKKCGEINFRLEDVTVVVLTLGFRWYMGFGNRGVISDKWSSRILWISAIGTAIGFYMVAVERQTQNRAKMMAEALGDAGSGGEETGS